MVRVLETITYECDAAKREDELNGTRSAGHGRSGAHGKQRDERALYSQSDRGVSRRYRKRCSIGTEGGSVNPGEVSHDAPPRWARPAARGAPALAGIPGSVPGPPERA